MNAEAWGPAAPKLVALGPPTKAACPLYRPRPQHPQPTALCRARTAVEWTFLDNPYFGAVTLAKAYTFSCAGAPPDPAALDLEGPGELTVPKEGAIAWKAAAASPAAGGSGWAWHARWFVGVCGCDRGDRAVG